MNIFYLDQDVQSCVEAHANTHVCKMIIEYAQLLSTAHRVLDGKEISVTYPNGKVRIVRHLDGEIPTFKLIDGKHKLKFENPLCYNQSHTNHPSGIWTRQSDSNYQYLFQLWFHLMQEFTYRYGKIHATARLTNFLANTPKNIPVKQFTQPTPAMPEEYKISGDSVLSYRNYYIGAKQRLAKWKSRPVPDWYQYLDELNKIVIN